MAKGRRVDATGRSKGDGKHVRLYRWMMKTEAWRTLSPLGRCLLIEFYDLYNGDNNGAIFLSVREAAKRLNCGTKQAHQAIRDLQKREFIKPKVRGSFTQKTRHATAWRLTEFDAPGQSATKDFVSWTDEEIQNTVVGENTDSGRSDYRGPI